MRCGIALTSTFAMQQCSRLLKSVDNSSQYSELQTLQRKLDSKIKIVSPALDLIEFKQVTLKAISKLSGQGNVFLENAATLAKALHHDFVALGKRFENAAELEELAQQQLDGRPYAAHDSHVKFDSILRDIKDLLARIDGDIPLLQLAITASGESLSTALPASISPSRLLQASMFLIMGDTQFSSNPYRPVQIGPSFTLSLYMLFLSHSASKPIATETARTATYSTNEQRDGVDSRPYGIGSGERRPIWQEVLHKARVRICRTPRCWKFHNGRGFLPVNSHDLQYEFEDGGIVSKGRVQSDQQENGQYAYHLEIIEDLDDGRVHDNNTNLTTDDNTPLTGIQEAFPIHQISKLFYTNSGRILNINADRNVENTSVLLLKRDTTDSAKFRPMSQTDSESEVTSWECDRSKLSEQQNEIDRQLREESSFCNNPEGVHSTDCTRADPENRSWRFPPHLDPEWLALEVFVEDSQDIDDSDSDEDTDVYGPRCSGGCAAPVGIGQPRHASVDAHLVEQMRNMAVSESDTPVQKQMLTDSNNVNDEESLTSDHMKSRTAKSPFGPVVTSLSLLEMLLRLTSLQQFQQTSHLSIPDHVLTFFLEETATTGLQGKERWKTKRVAEQKIGFDPFTGSPRKANRENQAMTKPGAGFGFQPTNTLAVSDSSYHDPPTPPKAFTSRDSFLLRSRDELAKSFCELIRLTTAVPPPHLPPLPAQKTNMPRSRSASFSDDDLMIVSSQAMSSQGYSSQDYASQELGGGLMSSPPQAILSPNNVVDVSSSPLAPASTPIKAGGRGNHVPGATSGAIVPTTRQPMFGRPTEIQMPAPSSIMSSAAAHSAAQAQRRQNAQSSMFNTNQKRPEHHRPQRLTGPLAPTHPNRKAAQRPTFNSLSSSHSNGGTAYPDSSFYSNTTTNKMIIKQSIPSSTHEDVKFYTDPDKAAADLKALLEGGMEEDEDEEGEAQPATEPGEFVAESRTDAPGREQEPVKTTKRKEPQPFDDGTVEGINVKLLPHQVEGVKWMRGRELGPVKRGRVPKGGILADDMGLGKTLQSISLILGNPRPRKDMPGWKKHYERIDGATLVVAPLALIRQWEAEIREKVSADQSLLVCVHHGPQRTVRPQDLARYDVVITTYQILVSEHSRSNDALKSGCFGLSWFRVILDEAHSIKNRNAMMTKACCALASEFRWCLTGTPMQNNLDELQSLIKFLRITPYDNLTEWRSHIDAPIKNGRGDLAIRRLHSLLRCFMKRRTKDILKEEGALVPGGKKAMEAAVAADELAAKDGDKTLDTSSSSSTCTRKMAAAPSFKITERNIVSVAATFSDAERKFYDQLEARADKSLEKMVKGQSLNYANALVLLLRLRQACNHPTLLGAKLEKDKDAMSTDAMPALSKSSATDNDIDALADVFGGLGIQARKCEICMSDLTKEEQRECEVACVDMVCSSCIEDREALNGSSKRHKNTKKVKSKKSRKHRKEKTVKACAKSKSTDASGDEDDSIILPGRKAKQRKPRNRRAIIDSDDEDNDGSWLVGEEERGSLRLGKAGGEKDENAEGGGDWINSDDSVHSSENEAEDASRLSSFVIDDEKEAMAAGGYTKGGKKSRSTICDRSLNSEESDDENFVSFARSAASATHSGSSSSGSGNDSGSSSDENSDDTSEGKYKVSCDSKIYRRRKNTESDSSAVLASAKIRRMLALLQAEAREHKFIVFSQFTSMLELISPFLVRAGLGHVRYEGSMRNDAREASLNSLRHDPDVRVLLCSLKCGALGLNLTAATRVIILEPFWNPFVEEQAIDRVHRLTQTVDVTVYKLTVEDTVEQRILALQDRKRLLAAQALEADTAGGRNKKEALKLGLKELMDLFKHDTRGPHTHGGSGDGSYGQDDVESALADQMAALSTGGLLRRRERSEGDGGSSQDSAYSRRW
ncbi:hypothetical protein SEPCBS57363_001351 [Sporothrix epigloea]|uniref:Snf2 family helicase n=1 Tax=Sporothrix epigloea TaxID=1892477 RepID=A0ABP0D9S6_9PEZI